MCDVITAKPNFVLHILGGTKILLPPFVNWSKSAMFFLCCFYALQKVHVSACIAQNLLAKFGGNLAMCH